MKDIPTDHTMNMKKALNTRCRPPDYDQNSHICDHILSLQARISHGHIFFEYMMTISLLYRPFVRHGVARSGTFSSSLAKSVCLCLICAAVHLAATMFQR